MKLINHAACSADLLRTASARSDDHMLGCVIARPVFALSKGDLVPSPDTPWPIGGAPARTPLGLMPGDKPFYSGGIDVLLGGAVRHANGLPDRRLDVEVEVGRTFRRRIAVFGDRRWIRDDKGRWTKTEPEPFVSMELSYARAFGGEVSLPDGSAFPYAPNPLGKGYIADAAKAEGQPLPNLEDPSHLVESPEDWPEPVGLGYYPMDGSLRALASLDHPLAKRAPTTPQKPGPVTPKLPDAAREPLRADQILPTTFNMAHPRMILPAGREPPKGDRISLTGGTRDGDLAFAMPDLAMHVHVKLEDRHFVFPMVLDQIGLLAGGEGRVFFSLRCVFEYKLIEGERRRVTLHRGPAPDPLPESYLSARPGA